MTFWRASKWTPERYVFDLRREALFDRPLDMDPFLTGSTCRNFSLTPMWHPSPVPT